MSQAYRVKQFGKTQDGENKIIAGLLHGDLPEVAKWNTYDSKCSVVKGKGSAPHRELPPYLGGRFYLADPSFPPFASRR